MIYTLTLNPCIDKTVTVDKFGIGLTNRASSYDKNICGKGINTAVAVNNLSRDVCAIFFDYSDGPSVTNFLSNKGISCKSIKVKGELRTNYKVYDPSTQKTTEINEKGFPVDKKDVSDIFELIVNSVNKGDVLTISGSVPPGVEDSFYHDIIKAVKVKDVKTILDADGKLLANGIKALPDMIKPNRDELSTLISRPVKNIDEVIDCARSLNEFGIPSVCVSLGKDGAVLSKGGILLKAVNDIDVIRGTVGAGDSMVAGFAIGMSENLSPEETLHMASALSAGSVSLPSTQICTSELYKQMYDKVIMTCYNNSVYAF